MKLSSTFLAGLGIGCAVGLGLSAYVSFQPGSLPSARESDSNPQKKPDTSPRRDTLQLTQAAPEMRENPEGSTQERPKDNEIPVTSAHPGHPSTDASVSP